MILENMFDFQGGMYVFQIFDFYSGSRIILLVALFELIAIAHVYGELFFQNIYICETVIVSVCGHCLFFLKQNLSLFGNIGNK